MVKWWWLRRQALDYGYRGSIPDFISFAIKSPIYKLWRTGDKEPLKPGSNINHHGSVSLSNKFSNAKTNTTREPYEHLSSHLSKFIFQHISEPYEHLIE